MTAKIYRKRWRVRRRKRTDLLQNFKFHAVDAHRSAVACIGLWFRALTVAYAVAGALWLWAWQGLRIRYGVRARSSCSELKCSGLCSVQIVKSLNKRGYTCLDSIYSVLCLKVVTNSELYTVCSEVCIVIQHRGRIILHVHRICYMTESVIRLLIEVFRQLLYYENICIYVTGGGCFAFNINSRLISWPLISFDTEVQSYVHYCSVNVTPPIVIGNLKFYLRKALKALLYCKRKAAAFSIVCLFTCLCGHVGQPLIAADAAAIRGKDFKSMLSNFC